MVTSAKRNDAADASFSRDGLTHAIKMKQAWNPTIIIHVNDETIFTSQGISFVPAWREAVKDLYADIPLVVRTFADNVLSDLENVLTIPIGWQKGFEASKSTNRREKKKPLR